MTTPGFTARAPAVSLCLLAAALPLVFAATLFEPFLETKELLLVAGAAAVAALWLVTGARPGLPRTRVWAVLAVLAGTSGLSLFRSAYPAASAAAAAHFTAMLLLFVVAASVMQASTARDALTAALTGAGAIEAAYVLCQALVGDPLFDAGRLAGKWRTFGTLGNPNWAGEFLAVALLAAWGRYAARRASGPRQKAVSAACLALIAMGLAATFARGAWLACAVGAAGFWLVRRAHAPAPRARLAAAAALAGAGVAAALVLALRPDTLAHLVNIASLRGRLWMWAVSGTMIREAPWGGFGLGTFGLHFPVYQARAFAQPWAQPFLRNGSFTPHAHQDFLQLWAEAGLLAPLALTVLAGLVLARGRRLACDPPALGCWAALVALGVNAVFASPLYLPASAGLAAVLLGAVEAAAAGESFRLLPAARPARWAACLAAAGLCAVAWPYCWRRAAADAAVGRAGAAMARRDWPAAAGALRAALASDPAHREAWSLEGRLRFQRRAYPEAAEAFERAARLGYDPEVFEGKAAALWKAGYRAAAVSTLEELARLRPDLPWPGRQVRALRAAAAALEPRSTP